MGRMGEPVGEVFSDDAVVAAGEVLFDEGERTVAEIAILANTLGVALVAREFNGFSDGFAASVFTDVNLTVANTALICNNANLLAIKAGSILNNASISVVDAYNILLHGNLSPNRTQSILYAMTFTAKLMDILTYAAGNLTVSGNTDIAGVNRYETLTVNGGITLTLTGQPSALIVDTIANSGSIVKEVSGGASGTRGNTGAGEGGQGAGGFVIFADVLGSSGVISADGGAGENGSDVSGSGHGGTGGTGAFHKVGSDVPGLGGYGAYRSGDPGRIGAGEVNGGGGGADDSYNGGTGGGSALTTLGSYATLAVKVAQYSIDWVIDNVLGKVPGAIVSINVYGSGGGGGIANPGWGADGGGGGGGGEVLAFCRTLNNSGTIRANAGVGGDGGTEGARDNEGGGGGGGLVYILYKSLTNAGTRQALGGAAGSGDSVEIPGIAGLNGVATSQAV